MRHSPVQWPAISLPGVVAEPHMGTAGPSRDLFLTKHEVGHVKLNKFLLIFTKLVEELRDSCKPYGRIL